MHRIYNQKLNKHTYLFSFARFFDRIGYYGTRMIIMLFMISQKMHLEQDKALNLYIAITMLYYATGILGGYLGDKVWGNKKTLLLGTALQVISLFLFCAETRQLFYFGLFSFILGGGLSYPNLLANYGKNNYSKKNTLDTSFTLIYLFSNLGAILGVLLAEYLYDFNGFKLTFLCLAVSYLIKLGLLIDTPSTFKIKHEKPNLNYKKNFIPIILLILCSGIYWGTFELMGYELNYIEYTLQSKLNIPPPSIKWAGVSTIITIVIALIALIAWTFYKIERIYKILIGLIIFVLSILLLIHLPDLGDDNLLLSYLLFFIIFGIAEVLVAPIILAAISHYSNPRYLATVYGVFFTVVICIILESYKLLPEMGLFSTISQMLYFALIPVIIIGLAIYINYQQNETSDQNQKSNNDVLDNFE